jgi:hypothetical protein
MAKKALYLLPREVSLEELQDDLLGGACDDGLEDALSTLGVKDVTCPNCGSVINKTAKLHLQDLLKKAMSGKHYDIVFDFFARVIAERSPVQFEDHVREFNGKVYAKAKEEIESSIKNKRGVAYDEMSARQYTEFMASLSKAAKGSSDRSLWDDVEDYVSDTEGPFDLDNSDNYGEVFDAIESTNLFGETDKERAEKLVELFPFKPETQPKAKKKARKRK